LAGRHTVVSPNPGPQTPPLQGTYPRPLAEIDADMEKQVAKILELLHEVEQ